MSSALRVARVDPALTGAVGPRQSGAAQPAGLSGEDIEALWEYKLYNG